MSAKEVSSGEAAKFKQLQKGVYSCTAEGFRIATARLDNTKGLKSIFKRRGNQSGTVEAVQAAFRDIVQMEDQRK
jgi:hypothetical protein